MSKTQELLTGGHAALDAAEEQLAKAINSFVEFSEICMQLGLHKSAAGRVVAYSLPGLKAWAKNPHHPGSIADLRKVLDEFRDELKGAA